MKKILTFLAALFIVIGVNAQSDEVDRLVPVMTQTPSMNDGFFASNYSEYRGDVGIFGDILPVLPSTHGLTNDQTAPVGSGLLLLAGMGIAYGIRKKTRKQ